MKILVITLLGLSAFTSCQKKYTCECTTTKQYDGSFQEGVIYDFFDVPTTNTRTIKAKKKEDAKASCESGTMTSYEPGYYEAQGQQPTVVTTICTIH